MSELQKSFAKAKLAKFPAELPIPSMDSLEEGDSSSASSTETVTPSPTKRLFARPARDSPTSTLSWTDFFAQELFLREETNSTHITHHVYLTPPTNSGPLFVMHHGAGSSGLSFATCAEAIRKLLPTAGILSLDARGHGQTTVTTADKNEKVPMDLSLETLNRDVVFIIRETQSQMGWESLPDIVLVGHSLGGAVITDVAKKGDLGAKVLAYAVLDVVEGSAMDALQTMEQYLSTRPSHFPSLASGIEWHTRSRTIRNRTSARVSVPSLLYEEEPPSDLSKPWVWRTNLAETKPFWENWFIGLSKKFLEARGGKLLLLAGTDRLDKDLMIGQMQGKYQLQVLPEAGHFVQEDQPVKTAQILVDFYKRNDRSALVLPPKVADMQASAAMKNPHRQSRQCGRVILKIVEGLPRVRTEDVSYVTAIFVLNILITNVLHSRSIRSSVMGGMNYHVEILFDDGVQWLARIRRLNATSPPPDLRDYIVQSEVATLQFLSKTNVPAPKVFDYGLHGQTPVGLGFILMEKLPGKSLRWSLASAEQRRKVMNQLADIYIELESLPFDTMGSLDQPGTGHMVLLGPYKNPRDYLRASVDLKLSLIMKGESYAGHGIDAFLVHRFLSDSLSEVLLHQCFDDGRFYRRHADDKGDHILINDDYDITGIIDWEWAYTDSKSAAFRSPIMLLPVADFYKGVNSIGEDESTFATILETKDHHDLAEIVRNGRLLHRFQFCCGYDFADWEGFLGLFQGLRNALNKDKYLSWELWKQNAMQRYSDDERLKTLLARY
ncbi:carboxyl methyl esterase activity protein [Aspergillus nanangensis]|uniref:Protein phosphatase methylesterase 1 n=1 Tax=Aspergillus nanangensis TaxID=2582783 RepID=A0AAD4GQI9_ASPNN|nr:carboxyl methyl esterase activity protein [Aspergillus nanangensis]